ncbi:MAG: hypothetical protein NTY81_03315 [Candidatus Staskawiczbacteria bacterium]|nr:hypothetical protein [Candidatus Staskawiczbacteria bacterium]
MKTFWKLATLFLFVVIVTGFYYEARWSNQPVAAVSLQLPAFQGRIMELGQVRPGMFLIERPFSEISGWGKDGIMTYGASIKGKAVCIEAWRPDPLSSAVFEHSEEIFDINFPRLYLIDKVKRDDGRLIITPQKDIFGVFICCVSPLVLLFLGIHSTFRAGWPKQCRGKERKDFSCRY